MVNIIKAEHQKAKRTMRKKFIWGFPLLTFVMAVSAAGLHLC